MDTLYVCLPSGRKLNCGVPMVAMGMETSVLPVFGENLRLLSEARGPLSAAAQGLGLSKAQFYRYLKAESLSQASPAQTHLRLL